MEDFIIELSEIQALFIVLTQAIEYCFENDKTTTHLPVLAEVINKRMSQLHISIEKFNDNW